MSGTDSASVLIVEDERHLANLFAGWLRDHYQTRAVYNGRDALETVSESTDIVLLDRRMPGMSGDEVLDELAGQGFEGKVAMVTAVEPDFDILEMGFDDYLVKPVSYDELRSSVDRLVRRRDYSAQLDEYAELLSKRAALTTEKNRAQLETNEEFANLESRIDHLGSQVDRAVDRFDEVDFAAVLHELPTGRGC